MRSAWLVLLTALAMSVASVALGPASAVAQTDEIAYRCDVDICLLDPASPKAVTNLTDNGTESLDGTPRWSPDGSKLAFIGTKGSGVRNIFVMEPGAGFPANNLATQLTFYEKAGEFTTDPVWSHDGSKIAFNHEFFYGDNSGVYVVKSDGTSAHPTMVAEEGQDPSWAPDGGKIAYAKGEQIYIANPDGSGTPAALANAPGDEPLWSPDGTRIAFANPLKLGSPFVNLQIVGAGCGASGAALSTNSSQWIFGAWSPNGAKLAYRAVGSAGLYLRVVNGDGSGDIGLPSLENVTADGYPPSWSPDGTRLVFYAREYKVADPEFHDNEIYVENSDGSSPMKALTTGEKSYEPDWRPDPQITPHVPVLCKTVKDAVGGGVGPTPEETRKPKIVWFTKRVYVGPGIDPNVRIGVYGCDGPACSVGTQGRAKGVTYSHPRPAARPGKKPKTIVIGRGQMTVPGGTTRPLTMKVSPAGIALAKSQGNVTVTVTVTTTGKGRKKVTEKHKIHLAYKDAAKHHS